MMKQMIEFYHSNADFKRFVDMNAASYNKDVNFVLAMPITREYFEMIQRKDVAVLVYSCDAYADVWDPFFTLFRRYWNCPYKVYLAAEHKRCLLTDVVTINHEAPTWTQRIRQTVADIPTKYIIGMCEDFFFRRDVRQHIIDKCIDMMENDLSIACFNFEKDYNGATDSNVPHFGIKPPGHNFQKSCQPTLWRRDILLELLDCAMDPWEWEESDTTDKYKFYVWTGDIDDIVFDYGYIRESWFGIRKGKWVEDDVKPLFEREGIKIDLGKRGIYTE